MNLQDPFCPVFWGTMVVHVKVLSNYSQRKLLSILSQKSLSRPQYHSMTKKSHVVWRRCRKSFRGGFLTTLVNEFLDRNLPWTSLLCRWHYLTLKVVDHSHGQVEPMVQLMVITVVSAAESQATQTSIQGAEASALQWGVDEEAIMTIPEILQLKAAT